MATSDKIPSTSELVPVGKYKSNELLEEKDRETNAIEKGKEKERDILAEIDYDPNDDAMHVDFNEDQWLPCIPGLSLTVATIIFAIIGAGVGIVIALAGPIEEKTKHIVMDNMNVTREPWDPGMNYGVDHIDVQNVYAGGAMNATQYVDYIYEATKTSISMEETEPLTDEWMKIISFPGSLWVNALKLLVLPLIILMMVVLPSRVDEIGFIGKRAIPLYLFTSFSAAIQGTCWYVQVHCIYIYM